MFVVRSSVNLSCISMFHVLSFSSSGFMLVSPLVISFVWLVFLFLATIKAHFSLKFSSASFVCIRVLTPQPPRDLDNNDAPGRNKATVHDMSSPLQSILQGRMFKKDKLKHS